MLTRPVTRESELKRQAAVAKAVATASASYASFDAGAAKDLRRLARGSDNVKVLTLCGGVPMGPQIGSLEHGAQVIVGTPGRVQKHLSKGTLSLDVLNTLARDLSQTHDLQIRLGIVQQLLVGNQNQ